MPDPGDNPTDEGEGDSTLSKTLANFGDTLSSTFGQTKELLEMQMKQLVVMQESHASHTTNILEQLQSAGNGVTTGKRRDTDPPTLSEVDPIKWASFKKCYKAVAKINKWTNSYAVQRLGTCIRDQAARAIDHLEFKETDELKDAIAKIEAVYLNPAGVEFFKAQFRLSNREPHETFLQWHTRCRELFSRAYPDEEDMELDEDLKERFLLGLRDRHLAAQIKISDRYDDWTYTDLLNRAQKIYGNTLIVHSAYNNKPLPSDGISSLSLHDVEHAQTPAVQAVQPQAKTIRCHYCNKLGHIAPNCFLRQRHMQHGQGQPAQNQHAWNKDPPFRPRSNAQQHKHQPVRPKPTQSGARGRVFSKGGVGSNGSGLPGSGPNLANNKPKWRKSGGQVSAIGHDSTDQQDDQDPLTVLNDSLHQAEN